MEKEKLNLMDFVHKEIESFIRTFPEIYEVDGDYYRSLVKRHDIRLNGMTFKYDQLRYFDKDKKYVKTLYIMLFQHSRLEDDDFYVSFTNETRDLNNNDKDKYVYGLFSKKLIPERPTSLLLELTGVQVKLLKNVRYDPFFFKYSNDFFSNNNHYPYMGVSINPLLVERSDVCLAAFICKSAHQNVIVFEIQEVNRYKYFGTVTKPVLYLKNTKEIKEDDEISW